MHIPDGVLDPELSIAGYIVSLSYAFFAFKRLRPLWGDLERMGVLSSLASAIFVAQMINWPLPIGISIHFLGSGLSGIILGPYYGFMSMLIVILVQTFIFHDGGISSLGFNIFNMCVVGVLAGYAIYRGLSGGGGCSKNRVFLAGFVAGWASTALAGLLCGLEIGLSKYIGMRLYESITIMGFWHTMLGFLEGLLTGGILAYLYTRSPQLLGGVLTEG